MASIETMNIKSTFDCVTCEKIIKAAQKGDMESHEVIFRQFSPMVYNLALRITSQKQAAEDILQNTFINVLNKIKSFRFEAPFGMWLRKITVNQVLMYLRKQNNHNKYHMSLLDEDNIVNLYPGLAQDCNYHDKVGHTESQFDLQVLMDTLPLQTRTVLWLKEVEGYTHQEIAEMMGKTKSYSKSVVSRAYQVLRSRFMKTSIKQSAGKNNAR